MRRRKKEAAHLMNRPRDWAETKRKDMGLASILLDSVELIFFFFFFYNFLFINDNFKQIDYLGVKICYIYVLICS